MPKHRHPTETKVSAAAIASAATAFVLWLASELVFTDDLPEPVAALVAVLVPAAVTWLAAYLAPHTPRVGTPQDRQ
ncbi:MAG: holin [Streptomycetales bacterium]